MKRIAFFEKLERHNKKMLNPDFWKDKVNSKNILKEKKIFEGLLNSYNDGIEKLKDLDELNNLALEENNQDINVEILENIKNLRLSVKNMRLKMFFYPMKLIL